MEPHYYHRADATGIGFDRTVTGSNAAAQYAPEAARRFSELRTVGDDYLLWFHNEPWDLRLDTGRTVWEELVSRYSSGVEQVTAMQRQWDALRPFVDPERHAEVTRFLAVQHDEAKWWRDACIAYFQSVSKRPLPPGIAPPAHPLSYYQAIRFPNAPGQPH